MTKREKRMLKRRIRRTMVFVGDLLGAAVVVAWPFMFGLMAMIVRGV